MVNRIIGKQVIKHDSRSIWISSLKIEVPMLEIVDTKIGLLKENSFKRKDNDPVDCLAPVSLFMLLGHLPTAE